MKCLCKLLAPFAGVTTRISGEEYPTFAIAFPYLRLAKGELQNEDIFEDVVAEAGVDALYVSQALVRMHGVRRAILELFTDRFRGMDLELMWVSLLNPKLAKMTYLRHEEKEQGTV
jgi:hypothetical protein